MQASKRNAGVPSAMVARQSLNDEELVRESGLKKCLECVTKDYFTYFSTKTYVLGTQKNHLNETCLMSMQHIC